MRLGRKIEKGQDGGSAGGGLEGFGLDGFGGAPAPQAVDNSSQFISKFDDPIKLMDVVEKNITVLEKRGFENANSYFRSQYIPDNVRLVTSAAVGFGNGGKALTVIQAFRNLKEVLNEVKQHIEKKVPSRAMLIASTSTQDSVVYEAVEKTEQSISTVLETFDQFTNFKNERLSIVKEERDTTTAIKQLNDRKARYSQLLSSTDAATKRQAQQDVAALTSALAPLQAKTALFASKKLALKEAVDRQYAVIMEKVLKEFDMGLQKSTMLAERMRLITQYDYTERVREGKNLTRYQNELLVLSGNKVLENFGVIIGNSPTIKQLDLSRAINYSKRNIIIVEQLTKNRLLSEIRQLYMMAYPEQAYPSRNSERPITFFEHDLITMKSATDDALNLTARPPWVEPESFRDYMKQMPKTGILDLINAAVKVNRINLGDSNSEKYRLKSPTILGMPNPWSLDSSVSLGGSRETKRHTVNLLAQLCSLTLSFSEPEMFYPYCRGSKLLPKLDPAAQKLRAQQIFNGIRKNYKWASEANVEVMAQMKKESAYYALDYDTTLKNSFRRTPWTDPRPYYYEETNDRVCAYRNFLRKNLVYYMLRTENR
ncbi:MAG: hypothetical protein EOP09_06180 [Proteobacteria bacterium]|nr:MAG: hypothetical protein EOP09_06180 [Pseudomonadota bacterium]